MNEERKVIAAGIVFIAMAYGIARFSYGLLLPYFDEPLHMSSQISGVISSLSYLTYCIGLTMVFTLMKNKQPRIVLLLSGVLSLLGLVMLVAAEEYIMFGIGVNILGFAAGVATVPFGSIIKETVKYGRQDRSNSWINTGIGLGLILTGGIVWYFDDNWRMSYLTFFIISLLIFAVNYKQVPYINMNHINNQLAVNRLFYGRKLIISTILLGMAISAYWTYFQSYIYQTSFKEMIPLFWIFVGAGGMLGGLSGRMFEWLGLKKVQIMTGLLLGVANMTLVLTDEFIVMMFSTLLFGLVYVFAMGVYAFWSARLYTEYPSNGVYILFISLAAGQFTGTFLSGFILAAGGFWWLFIIYGIFSLLTVFFRPLEDEIEEI